MQIPVQGVVAPSGNRDVSDNLPLSVGPGMPSIILGADFTVSTTAASVLSSVNSKTSRIAVINTGTATIYLKNTDIETNVPTTANSLPLLPGQNWHCRATSIPQAICASGTVIIRIVQLG